MSTKTIKSGLSKANVNAIAGAIGTATLNRLVPQFSTGVAYTKGQYTNYNNQLYRFTADKSAGAWDSTKVESASLNDLINDVNDAVASVTGKANTADLLNGTLVVSKAKTAEQVENVSPESGTTQITPFNLQATGTDDNTTSTPTAPVAKHLQIRGNCVKFRQLAKALNSTNYGFSSANGSISDGLATFTATAQNGRLQSTPNYTSIAGHYYLLIISVKLTTGTTNVVVFNNVAGGTQSVATKNTTDWQTLYIKAQASQSHDSNIIVRDERTSDWDAIQVKNIMLFDLTDIELTRNKTYATPLEFVRDYPLPYYDNQEVILFPQTNKLTTIERNQFAVLDTDIEVVNGSWYRLAHGDSDDDLVNIASGSIKEYDGAKNLIKTSAYSDLVVLYGNDSDYEANDGLKGIKLQDETRYVQLSGISESKIMFELAWDGLQTGYEERIVHEYDLPTMNKPYSVSKDVFNYVGADGLEHDVVDNLDLSQQTWYYNSSHNYWYCVALRDLIKKPNYNSDIANISCDKLRESSFNDVFNNTTINSIGIQSDGTVAVYNGSSSIEPTGILYYQKATESTSQLSSFAENIDVHDYGVMKYHSTQTESASNPIAPQGNQFFYPADYVLLVDDLNTYVDGDVRKLALKNDVQTIDAQLQNAIGGTLRHCLAIQESGLDFEETDFVDLGTMNWSYNSTYQSFQANPISGAATNNKMISTKYKVVSNRDWTLLASGQMVQHTNGNIYIKTGSSTEKPSGLLAYEKA